MVLTAKSLALFTSAFQLEIHLLAIILVVYQQYFQRRYGNDLVCSHDLVPVGGLHQQSFLCSKLFISFDMPFLSSRMVPTNANS